MLDGLEVARLVPQEISHYRIIERLGAGGMGEVFLAQDIRLDRKVAIKMLPAESIGNELAKKRLFREARAAAALDHPNICAIYEVGEEGDCAYIVMQYIEGRTLSRVIKNHPLSPRDVVDIGIQSAAALAEAHSRGVIHRDIKPHNAIITSRGQVKILDFGLAKFFEDEPAVCNGADTESRLTDTGAVVGTVGYMSPEQLTDLPVDARTDLFSLGVMLYECATGKSAFAGSSKIEICMQVIQFDPPRPSEIDSTVPSGLDDIILKAMAKDVVARYQSAQAMLDDLRALQGTLEGSVLETQPLTPRPGALTTKPGLSLSGSIRGAPARVKVGAVVIALVILGVLLALRYWHPSPHQPSAEAKTWYDRGTQAMKAGTYYQAGKLLERSVQIDDRFALAHARLADTYNEIDNTEKAMEELLHALSLVPDRSAMVKTDVIYLDAVGATIRRDLDVAIGHYSELVDQAPDLDKANAYVDLGRSYEKRENLDKAIECYLEATKRDSQSAAAFLRLAILYGRRQDWQNADDAFGQAEKIYKLMSNQEGSAEVFYQRGALLAKAGRLSEAKSQLEKVESLQNDDNKYQLVKTQLQLSSVYHVEGNTERAKKVATDAIALAQASNIRSLATNGLIDLGYTLLNRGEFVEARSYFKQALDFAQRDKTPRSEARALLALGSLNQQQGNSDEAISSLEQALKFYEPGGYRKETSIALLLLGRAHQTKGDSELAFKTFAQQLELARGLGDPAQVSATLSSIALLLGIDQERYPEALTKLDEAYKIDELRGSKASMGFDQMDRGIFLGRLGRYDEARSALDRAFSISNEASYKELLAWVHLIKAQIALSERNFREAKKIGQQALDLSATQYRKVALQAKYTIGLAEAFSGASQPAKNLCEEAVVIAREVNAPQLVSSALMALAEVLLQGNDGKRALETALEAQAIFTRSGQQDSEWRTLLIAARASDLTGDKSAMQDYASRANKLCTGLEQKWGKEAYTTYLSRPDIQSYRKQIAQILTRNN
jgi:serine/threonine protein kinase/tetratricopeptide (TPR) repeat protein